MTDSMDIRMTSTTQLSTISGHPNSPSLSYQLPFELEREICEIAAYNFPECILNLILVARRFRIWIEPELYRIIVSGSVKFFPPLYLEQPEESESNSDSDSDSDSLCRVLDKERIRSFGNHVQHIWLWRKTPTEIAKILECCPNVFNLALWLIKGDPRNLIPILENLPLRRLSIDPSGFFPDYSIDDGIPLNHPIFSNLTHFQLIGLTSSWSTWKQLALLPNLTHLALYLEGINQELIDRVLKECRNLELLLPSYHDLESLAAMLEMPQKDDRVVLYHFGDNVKWIQWEKSACGEEDFWTRAQVMKEEAIEARKRNGALRAATGQA